VVVQFLFWEYVYVSYFRYSIFAVYSYINAAEPSGPHIACCRWRPSGQCFTSKVCQNVALLIMGGGDVAGGESLLYPHEVGEVCDTKILP
jgi:hypothetical protein